MSAPPLAPPITIRAMTERDLRAVRRLERAAYGRSAPGTPFERDLRNGLAEYVVATDPLRPRRSMLGVAVDAMLRRPREPLLGFAGVWYMVDQLHIVTIAVDPAAQRRSIGTRLLLHCFALAEQAELPTIALEVRPSNTRALRMYERFGFQRVGRLAHYYSDNDEDALVMLSGNLATPAEQSRLAAIRAALADTA